jgi:hypothetical protein
MKKRNGGSVKKQEDGITGMGWKGREIVNEQKKRGGRRMRS